MPEQPYGNRWPPLDYDDLILRVKSRARSSHEEKDRRYSRYTQPGERRLFARLLGAGVPRWWLELEGRNDYARRLSSVPARGNPLDCEHDRGYALDGLFRVQTFLICRHCHDRLDWPNFLQGRRVVTRNWQARPQGWLLGAAAWLFARLRRRA